MTSQQIRMFQQLRVLKTPFTHRLHLLDLPFTDIDCMSYTSTQYIHPVQKIVHLTREADVITNLSFPKTCRIYHGNDRIHNDTYIFTIDRSNPSTLYIEQNTEEGFHLRYDAFVLKPSQRKKFV